jgi:hypothetical protein
MPRCSRSGAGVQPSATLRSKCWNRRPAQGRRSLSHTRPTNGKIHTTALLGKFSTDWQILALTLAPKDVQGTGLAFGRPSRAKKQKIGIRDLHDSRVQAKLRCLEVFASSRGGRAGRSRMHHAATWRGERDKLRSCSLRPNLPPSKHVDFGKHLPPRPDSIKTKVPKSDSASQAPGMGGRSGSFVRAGADRLD